VGRELARGAYRRGFPSLSIACRSPSGVTRFVVQRRDASGVGGEYAIQGLGHHGVEARQLLEAYGVTGVLDRGLLGRWSPLLDLLRFAEV
jgi:hypothetical protein